ncbi:MAG: peroxidase [Nocardioidaceae bacterium]|nr:peroxidase [Nocardioidaceae bacterium]
MTRPQAILAPPARAAIFLVVTVPPGAEADVRDLLTEVSGLSRTVGVRIPEGGLTCVVGIGSELWDRMYAGLPRPAFLHPFAPLQGAKHAAVSTPGDLLFHLRAERLDLCFELARLLTDALPEGAEVVDEVHGFRYFDERDLLGFVDGTENPQGLEASDAVLVTDGDPTYAGSSYVIVQKYLHDLAAWEALTVEQQELAIGRRKSTNLELSDEVKPASSHVALTTITDPDGTERAILRDNMVFGEVGTSEFGTYFIGYAADPGVTERMLRNMFIGDPEGTYDRILDFSTAVTGSLFFVPSGEFLDDPSKPG